VYAFLKLAVLLLKVPLIVGTTLWYSSCVLLSKPMYSALVKNLLDEIVACAQPLALCNQPLSSLPLPEVTKETGISWYPSIGAVITVPFLSVLVSRLLPTGGYSP